MTHAPAPPSLLADLRAIVERLDKLGRLARVRTPVDPVHQLAAIAARFEGKPYALLFENVAGSGCPVLIGLYWSRELLADLFDVPQPDLSGHITRCIAQWQKAPMAPVVVPNGAVQEVSEDDVDLSRLPIPTHAALDGGPYLDAAVLIARDPEILQVGFDATRPYPPVPAHTRAVTHPVDLKDFEILLPHRP